jgi:protein-S-isoprenylcysteine O-methyltransferase Ste14
MKKILPPILFLVSVLLMVLPWKVLPLSIWVSYPFNLLGLIPLFLGLGLTIIGSRKFDQVGTNIKTFNDPNVLVTEGVFKYSRNPMYLGFVLALVGVSVLLGALSSLLVAIAFFVITDRWYVRFEEQAMLRIFGDSYVSYKARTRRWV